jgi:hypothetical protein
MGMNFIGRWVLAAAFGGSWMSAPACADSLPSHLQPCVSLQRDAERLACYDKAVANMLSGDEAIKPVSAENMFGASTGISSAGSEQSPVKREELRQISGIVTSLRHTDDGMIVLELDNGQVWRQQDAEVKLMMATGDPVKVVRASLGTFRIADKTGRFARFKRVR